MTKNLNKRPLAATLWLASAAIAASCTKDDGKLPGPAAAALSPTDAQTLIAQVGVEPGRVEGYGGASAVLATVHGRVELRRLGEDSFAGAKKHERLHPGDQIRAGEGASATILFADESSAELAELSALAIGSRAATADPASSASVLSGVARFTASARAPGEGPFVVFTPAGVVATKGTVFGVGVAAGGNARVGVEQGAVEVAGAAALDAPVGVEASSAVELSATGNASAPSAWSEDDWGAWRDRAEADLDVSASASAHGDAMAAIAGQLASGYRALEELGKQVASFEAEASLAASADDPARYRAGLPEAGVAIDGSFLSALRLAWLTDAYASHAALATDLYVRHPDVVAWAKLAPQVHAAVLWPKRFDALAVAYLEPLRLQYYLHHPRGRVQAAFVGVAVPDFYANVTPPALSGGAQLDFKAFVPPIPLPSASARAIWIADPSADWQVDARLHAAPPRGQVAFWVRPPQLRAKATLGAAIRAQVAPCFEVRPPEARAHLKTAWGVALGHKIKLAPPNLAAAARARRAWNGADFHAEAIAGLPDLKAHADANLPAFDAKARANLKANAPDLKAKADLKGKLKAKANFKAKVSAPELRAKAELKAKADAAALKAKLGEAKAKLKAGASAKAGAEARIKAAGEVKVKPPEIKPPKVSASVKGSAKLSLGK